MLDTGQEIRAQPLYLARDPDLLQSRQQRLQGQSQFETCKMRTAAEMLAPAEGEMIVRPAFEIKDIRCANAASSRLPDGNSATVWNLTLQTPSGNPRDLPVDTRQKEVRLVADIA
ncbi:MAG TPA: hypothetical protein VMH37_15455 [Candidatus Binataceae bacterium]|nr:hypothetical protein [Candidatus Binataceae bacterium]